MTLSAQPLKQQLHSDPLIVAHKGAAAQPEISDAGVGNSAQRDLEPMEEQLVALLRRGWVSPQDALRQIGLFSLAQRVSEMRRERGLPIVDEWRQVGRSRFKCYRIFDGEELRG